MPLQPDRQPNKHNDYRIDAHCLEKSSQKIQTFYERTDIFNFATKKLILILGKRKIATEKSVNGLIQDD